ncbi:unnamed protein product [Didymodactylos carnosus]|uniref:Peptidase S1 domain-containing protein n=1 Tax=Didymodactylos carnosus TaxID=1234261 RepID=A0A814DA28_9BILA|nr:unnamed protein product [Didymodactylos carnosus]CAF3727163.1 unnamed protein product [Didymodactylos carnosus]
MKTSPPSQHSESIHSLADETSLHSGSFHSNLNEQIKSEEFPSDLSMKLINSSNVNKPSNTFDSLGSNSDLSTSMDRTRYSYKAQKQNYLTEKKRITNELVAVLRDSPVIVLADWLKVRGTLRDWTKLWVILKPGLLLLYKRPQEKNSVWVGTVVLNSCQVIQRPSKKHGFCFKIFHPLEKSIWSARGPNGEAVGALTFPLPMTHLIFRASDENTDLDEGDRMSDVSAESKATGSTSHSETSLEKLDECETKHEETYYIAAPPEEMGEVRPGMDLSKVVLPTFILEPRSFLEKLSDYYHHADLLEEAIHSSDPYTRMKTVVKFYLSGFYKKPKGLKKPYNPVIGELYRCYWYHSKSDSKTFYISEQALYSVWFVECINNKQQCGQMKSFFDSKIVGGNRASRYAWPWQAVINVQGQFTCGGTLIDVRHVVTAAHCISGVSSVPSDYTVRVGAHNIDSNSNDYTGIAYQVVRLFVNERFRDVEYGYDIAILRLQYAVPLSDFVNIICLPTPSYPTPDYTSVIITGFGVTSENGVLPNTLQQANIQVLPDCVDAYDNFNNDRQICAGLSAGGRDTCQGDSGGPLQLIDKYGRWTLVGITSYGEGCARIDYPGNSVSAILDGSARLTLLNQGEDYSMTLPYANCKGILIGKLQMELGGRVQIICEKTRYSAEIDFRLKPFIGGNELTNQVEGKIKLGKETLATIIGHWDDQIDIIDKATSTRSVLWKVNPSVVKSRLKRFVVPIEQQNDNESEKQNDQNLATEEKTIVEEQQRKQLKELKTTGNEWKPQMFILDPVSKEWIYLHADLRPWDSYNDIVQYESNFIISTKQRHHAPLYTSGASRSGSMADATATATSNMIRGPSPSLVRKRSDSVRHDKNDNDLVVNNRRISNHLRRGSHDDNSDNSYGKYFDNELEKINRRVTRNEDTIHDLKLRLDNQFGTNHQLINSLLSPHSINYKY